jgi:hypothetical protein
LIGIGKDRRGHSRNRNQGEGKEGARTPELQELHVRHA